MFVLSRAALPAAGAGRAGAPGWAAAAQVRVDAAGHEGEAPAIWRDGHPGAFCYPLALLLRTADASADVARDWLAGFATFTACIKMWRRLRDAPEQGHPRELRVNHINILARDLGRSVDFYRRIFGASYCYNLGPKKVVMELNGFDFFIEQADVVAYPPGYHFGVRADPDGVKAIAALVEAHGGIRIVKGNGPAPGFHAGPDRVRTAFYFQDPDGLEIEVYSPEIEMLESNPQLISQHLSPS
ncbi:glyoxylase/bleomycin resistance protein/dioxygenase superfamily protein [Burkholderia pseudomallei]|nr:glyoxylase/bleomycin resistance protein/dioxygenase superfamily protein [Burkholderia pseudomallei]CAJ3628594.1 glyoxylase/bleomycin resistance protein/dioxygenase superfamily protein [Burkholderia pseudomallei]CAJ4294748.1 glyoxylase/bleomycin resistance protein/dioxygenase superfamily protein [Burkholderia pseudomallei]CAJ4846588.1 glyoxylase/bleomycin resistance protein/dioxygenase superfamily protein [Burkholderia pseudomallei]CAJ5497392.1 glyoxylase/bleomycin resistance protein/dioxygen